jgi:hypothetical protein
MAVLIKWSPQIISVEDIKKVNSNQHLVSLSMDMAK